jgi:hypothetical protein
VLDVLHAGEMPPDDGRKSLAEAEDGTTSKARKSLDVESQGDSTGIVTELVGRGLHRG